MTLTGSWSSDQEAPTLTFHWEQSGGETVTLIDGDKVNASFVAPAVNEDIKFTLTVIDGALSSDPDEIVISVSSSTGFIVTDNFKLNSLRKVGYRKNF